MGKMWMFLGSLERKFPVLSKADIAFNISPLLRAPELQSENTFFEGEAKISAF